MNVTTEQIAEMTRVARENGLASLTIGDVTITIGPAPVSAAPQIRTAIEKLVEEAERQFNATCRCGHHHYDHRADVGCTRGCPIEACVKLPTKPGEPMDPFVVAAGAPR